MWTNLTKFKLFPRGLDWLGIFTAQENIGNMAGLAFYWQKFFLAYDWVKLNLFYMEIYFDVLSIKLSLGQMPGWLKVASVQRYVADADICRWEGLSKLPEATTLDNQPTGKISSGFFSFFKTKKNFLSKFSVHFENWNRKYFGEVFEQTNFDRKKPGLSRRKGL